MLLEQVVDIGVHGRRARSRRGRRRSRVSGSGRPDLEEAVNSRFEPLSLSVPVLRPVMPSVPSRSFVLRHRVEVRHRQGAASSTICAIAGFGHREPGELASCRCGVLVLRASMPVGSTIVVWVSPFAASHALRRAARSRPASRTPSPRRPRRSCDADGIEHRLERVVLGHRDAGRHRRRSSRRARSTCRRASWSALLNVIVGPGVVGVLERLRVEDDHRRDQLGDARDRPGRRRRRSTSRCRWRRGRGNPRRRRC